jgi:hypothetical protein
MEGDWQLLRHDPITGTKTYILDIGTHYVVRKEIPVDDILEDVAMERSANAGKRWGDGQVIGSVPLPLAFSSGYMKARVNGDTEWIKRFWNDPDHRKLRTFEGNI